MERWERKAKGEEWGRMEKEIEVFSWKGFHNKGTARQQRRKLALTNHEKSDWVL